MKFLLEKLTKTFKIIFKSTTITPCQPIQHLLPNFYLFVWIQFNNRKKNHFEWHSELVSSSSSSQQPTARFYWKCKKYNLKRKKFAKEFFPQHRFHINKRCGDKKRRKNRTKLNFFFRSIFMWESEKNLNWIIIRII